MPMLNSRAAGAKGFGQLNFPAPVIGSQGYFNTAIRWERYLFASDTVANSAAVLGAGGQDWACGNDVNSIWGTTGGASTATKNFYFASEINRAGTTLTPVSFQGAACGNNTFGICHSGRALALNTKYTYATDAAVDNTASVNNMRYGSAASDGTRGLFSRGNTGVDVCTFATGAWAASTSVLTAASVSGAVINNNVEAVFSLSNGTAVTNKWFFSGDAVSTGGALTTTNGTTSAGAGQNTGGIFWMNGSTTVGTNKYSYASDTAAVGANMIISSTGAVTGVANGIPGVNASGPTIDSDPYFSDVVFLSNMNGAAGSTIADVKGHTVTVGGTAAIAADQKLFGYNTLKLPGASFLTVASTTDFAFGTGDFTLEGWVYLTAYSGGNAGGGIFATINGALSGYAFQTGQNVSTCRMTSNATGTWIDNLTVPANGGIALNTWVFMTFERSAGTLRIYRNGVVMATLTGAAAYNFTGTNGYIGRFADSANTFYVTGFMGPQRVTKRARYNGAFTPPSGPFPTK